MTWIDWCVLFGTLLAISLIGAWKTRRQKDIGGYLLGDKQMNWFTMGVSVMATQASAITFLSVPGQAYTDGMRFVQFYFGLPLAMVVLCVTFIPIFYKLKVYTAYEYLEGRFDLKTRQFTSFLFMLQRGLAAGITIYAPAIVLSKMLGLPLTVTNLIIGVLVIIYTVTGGTKAVSKTQKYQMGVIFVGMIAAFVVLIKLLPETVSFGNAVQMAGKLGKLNAVTFDTALDDRYNLWSGLLGGFFLAMAYFGTDQSQVQRYLAGSSITQSRLSLLFNGMLKVPMQFFILFIGVMVFVFYHFHQPPVFFNQPATQQVYESEYADDLQALESEYTQMFDKRKAGAYALSEALKQENQEAIQVARQQIAAANSEIGELRQEVIGITREVNPRVETEDADYIFITFIMDYLPAGLVGLLLAVIFSAAMSSTAGELNALASTATVDIYKRSVQPNGSDRHYVVASKWFTVFWGVMAILFATLASLVDNLIQAVNILGSIFYGTVLGIFITAFYLKRIRANAVFFAAVFAQLVVLYCYVLIPEIEYLWYNLIGCLLVVLGSMVLQQVWPVKGKGV